MLQASQETIQRVVSLVSRGSAHSMVSTRITDLFGQASAKPSHPLADVPFEAFIQHSVDLSCKTRSLSRTTKPWRADVPEPIRLAIKLGCCNLVTTCSVRFARFLSLRSDDVYCTAPSLTFRI